MNILAQITSFDPVVTPAARVPRHSREEEHDSGPCTFASRLAGLIPLTLQDLAAIDGLIGYARPVERHTMLLDQGCVADHALVILDGFACRHKRRMSGRRQIVSFLLPGDHCDRGAVHAYPLDHAIETLTQCRVAKIPRATYLDLLGQHPRLALALQRAKLVEEAMAREWIASLGMRSSIERMAHLLCELMERLGSIGQASDGHYDLPLTQVDLADALGLSSVHVNRSIQFLRRDGLIALNRRHLQILAPRRLYELAEFEAAYLSHSPLGTGLPTGGPVAPYEPGHRAYS